MSPQLDQEISQFMDDFQQPENYRAADVKSRLLDLQITAHAGGDELPAAYYTFVKVCASREFVPWPVMEHCLEHLLDQAYAAAPVPA